MSRKHLGILLVAGLVVAGAGPRARAGLVGTSVTGSLTFPTTANPTVNYWDPANGYVPAGYLNHSGTTVTISATQVEFGFVEPGSDQITADFTGGQLTIQFVELLSGGGAPFPETYTFTDTAFAGGTFTKGSDTFPGGLSLALSGDTLTVNWGGDVNALPQGTTLTGVLDFTPASAAVPEPSSLCLAMLGGVSFAGYGWRRARRA